MRLSGVVFLTLNWFSLIVADATLEFPDETYTCTLGPGWQRYEKIAPKVMIISMFKSEADIWYKNLPSSGLGDLLAMNISVPGLSPMYPQVHCTEAGDICQMTAGESEINAATSLTSLVLGAASPAPSAQFDLRRTYFLAAGIAGVNPKLATLGGVALARFAVQVALQYELDMREAPPNLTTGYVPYGRNRPSDYPAVLYGTEVLELNAALRDAAAGLASKAALADSVAVAGYRARYADAKPEGIYKAATSPPAVHSCDVATSDVYYSGTLLSEAFENTTRVWTNQTDLTYCMSAQEDTAVLEVLLRSHLWGLVDYKRAIVMRTGSNFDRPPPGVSAYDHLLHTDQNGFDVAIENLYLAGVEIVRGIVRDWGCTYEAGVQPTNYVGDVFGSLGGTPNFGPGSVFGGRGACADGESQVDSSAAAAAAVAGVGRTSMLRRARRSLGLRKQM